MSIALLTCYITTEYHVVLYAYMYKQITGSIFGQSFGKIFEFSPKAFTLLNG